MIGFNAAIALAYILNALYFATRFPVRSDLARWTLAAQGFAAIFFITCAGTHIALASAIYASNTANWWFHWDMLLDHGLQAPAGLGFAYIAWRKLDLHLIAQKSNEMTDLSNFRAAVLDGAISAIITMDVDGTVLDWNQAAVDIFHYSREEAEGVCVRDLIGGVGGEETMEEWALRLRGYMEHGEGLALTGQAPCRTKEGAIVICDYGLKRFESQYGPRLVSFLRDVTARIEAEQGRRRALARLLHAEAEQRRLIAEELHDDTIQVMTGTLLKLDTCEMRVRELRHHIHDGDAIFALEDYQVMLTTAIVSLREALRRTRRMMFELRPPMLQEHGVGPAVVALAGEIDRETGSRSEVNIGIKRYPDVVEELIYRVILESLTNVRKHAKAATVLIDVIERDGGIHGTIKDDGLGFDMAGILEREEQHLHLGLDSCTERVKMAGGRYFIASQPGSGTTVSFDLPTGNGQVLTWGDLYEAVN